MKPKTITLMVRQESIRIDLALLEALQNGRGRTVSRATLKKYFNDKQVLWRGNPAPASLLLPEGVHEVVLLKTDFEQEDALGAAPARDDFSIPIIYEDEELLVLHKPSGVPSAPLSSGETETAANFAVSHVKEILKVGRKGKGLEPGLLHRLDTGTSGLLVFAKTQLEFERLHLMWKNREVQKYYRALVQSSTPFPKAALSLNFPIAHDSHSSKKMIALIGDLSPRELKNKVRGKPLQAITHIQSVHIRSEALADFDIRIETGVMHQIRCQLASQGWPILGDPIYRGAPSKRLWLHAWRLKIPLKSGVILTLQAELPKDWLTTTHAVSAV